MATLTVGLMDWMVDYLEDGEKNMNLGLNTLHLIVIKALTLILGKSGAVQ